MKSAAWGMLGALVWQTFACSEAEPSPSAMAGAAGSTAGAAAGAKTAQAGQGGTPGGAPTLPNGGAGAPGAAGAEGGSGGTPSAAGASGSGGAIGGAAGAAGGTGLCAQGDCSMSVGALDGYLFEYPCAAGNGCTGTPCSNGALTVTRAFQIMGDPKLVYRVELRVRGVVESKNYQGGKRRSMLSLDPGPKGGDLWYEGGTVPASSYGTYELHVTPAVDGAPNDYYLNARDGTDEHDGTTWALDYVAEIRVKGGGTITFKSYDSNCSAITNCGPKGSSGCTPRTLDMSSAVPKMAVIQPIRNSSGTSEQWVHIDVTSVAAP